MPKVPGDGSVLSSISIPGCAEGYNFLLGSAVQGYVVLLRREVDFVEVHVRTVSVSALHELPGTCSERVNKLLI